MKVLIQPLIAHSVVNQADLIKKLLEQKGFIAEYRTTITLEEARSRDVHAVMWVTLATIQFLGDAVWVYLMLNKPKAVYVTIEGVPTKANVLYSNLPRLEFIANSRFTANCLTTVGLKVIDVVHHAVDMDLANAASKSSWRLRRKLEEKFKDKVKLLFVGRDDPRKALDKLNIALHMLVDEGIKDFALILHAPLSAYQKFQWLEEYGLVYHHGDFGSTSMYNVLQLMHACDYLVFPSVCEGFGLPVLEANAVGRPAIHAWIPPFDEFSSKEFNFVFNYLERRLVKCNPAQYWIFHDYPPEFLAEMIKYAIEVYKNSRSEYEEYCAKAKDHAKAWDYRKVYPRLLKHINIP